MVRITTPKWIDHAAKQCQFHIGVSKVMRSTLVAIGKWAVGLFVILSLVTSTLFILTSCGSASPTHVTPTPTPAIPNPYPPHQGTLVLNDPLKDNSRGLK